MAKKENIANALNKIECMYKLGNVPVYEIIKRNFDKGYKPAKDFVKKLADKIEQREFANNVDILNYLTNLEPSELIPHTYSKYPKTN